jgi:hypothetical protein
MVADVHFLAITYGAHITEDQRENLRTSLANAPGFQVTPFSDIILLCTTNVCTSRNLQFQLYEMGKNR